MRFFADVCWSCWRTAYEPVPCHLNPAKWRVVHASLTADPVGSQPRMNAEPQGHDQVRWVR